MAWFLLTNRREMWPECVSHQLGERCRHSNVTYWTLQSRQPLAPGLQFKLGSGATIALHPDQTPPVSEYHLWHILPGNGNGRIRNCSSKEQAEMVRADRSSTDFSQNLWVHTAPSPNGPWSRVGTRINVTGLLNGTTAQQTWCSAPYYYPNGTALLIWLGLGLG